MIQVGDFRTLDVPRADLVLCDPPYGLAKVYGGEREAVAYEDWIEALLASTSAPWRLFFGPPIPTIDYGRVRPDRVIVWTKSFAQIRKTLQWWQYGVTPILVYREPDAPWYGDARHPGVTGRAIARKLIEPLTKPGDLVVDPMAGTGSILVAAKGLGRRVWGAETVPEYAAAADEWLRTIEPSTKPDGCRRIAA